MGSPPAPYFHILYLVYYISYIKRNTRNELFNEEEEKQWKFKICLQTISQMQSVSWLLNLPCLCLDGKELKYFPLNWPSQSGTHDSSKGTPRLAEGGHPYGKPQNLKTKTCLGMIR